MIFNRIKIFLRKKWVIIPIIISFFINALMWIIIFRVIDFSRTLHALHYNFYFGIDYLNAPKYIFFAPILGILFIIFNTFIAYSYNQKKELQVLPHFLFFSNIFLNLIFLFYLLKIISIEY